MNSHKIAVFYLIGQFEDWWDTHFYIPQMNLLKDTGLYDNIDFIDISVVGGKQPLPFIPDKIKSINYIQSIKEKENGLDDFAIGMWEFAKKNHDYKIFHFHSHGISYKNSSLDVIEKKTAFSDFMNFCNIELWEECVNLLNWYDCVGAHVLKNATYYLESDKYINLYAPHFPGEYWWANATHISSLDPIFLTQKVPWKNYLCEMWIGSNSPRMYEFQYLPYNPYMVKTTFSKEELREKVKKDLDIINDPNTRVPYP